MKFLGLLTTISLFFVSLLFLFKTELPKPQYQDMLQNKEILLVPSKNQTEVILDTINRYKKNITSVYISQIEVNFKQTRIPINLYGFLAYEKDKKFRFQLYHRFTGKEIDVGSNENEFWFYAKRSDPINTFVGKYEFSKLNLKSALHPDWILESTNLYNLPETFNKIYKSNDNLLLCYEKQLSNGEKVKISTLIDSKRVMILGKYLHDYKDKLLSSIEYLEFEKGLPSKVKINWYEENVTMIWKMNPQINVKLAKNFWERTCDQDKIIYLQ
jgi:hypothetical protein